jgi:hypothetical protein
MSRLNNLGEIGYVINILAKLKEEREQRNRKRRDDVEYFHYFFNLVYYAHSSWCPPGVPPPLLVASQVVVVVVSSFGSGQFGACGPWPPGFSQVVVVVVVVVAVIPLFTGSSDVVVVVVVLGGLARAASGAAIIIAVPIANIAANNAILEFMCCICSDVWDKSLIGYFYKLLLKPDTPVRNSPLFTTSKHGWNSQCRIMFCPEGSTVLNFSSFPFSFIVAVVNLLPYLLLTVLSICSTSLIHLVSCL